MGCPVIWVIFVALSVLAALGLILLPHKNRTLHYENTVEADVDSVREYITNNIPTFLQEYHSKTRTQ